MRASEDPRPLCSEPANVAADVGTLVRDLAPRFESALQLLRPEEIQRNIPGRWSIQQILEHLGLTYDTTTSTLAERLRKGRPTQARPSVAQTLKRFLIVQCGRFPSGAKAPAAVTPSASASPKTGPELCSYLYQQLAQLDDHLNLVADRFGPETRSVSHIALGPLTPSEWRRFHEVHGLHHLRQIGDRHRQARKFSPSVDPPHPQ